MRIFMYRLMLVFTILSTIGGVLTLVPAASATYPNMIGYRSLCTFTPAATFACLLIAGLSCFIRAAFIKDRSGTAGERFRKHAKSFIPLTLLAVTVILLTIVFADIKSGYNKTDDTSAPTEQEG